MINRKENFKINLKRLIEESEYKTINDFAKNGMKVKPSTASHWISRGLSNIDTIYSIAKVLKVDIKDLLD